MFILYMVLIGYNKEQYVVLINFNHMTILLKRGVLVALSFCMQTLFGVTLLQLYSNYISSIIQCLAIIVK